MSVDCKFRGCGKPSARTVAILTYAPVHGKDTWTDVPYCEEHAAVVERSTYRRGSTGASHQ